MTARFQRKGTLSAEQVRAALSKVGTTFWLTDSRTWFDGTTHKETSTVQCRITGFSGSYAEYETYGVVERINPLPNSKPVEHGAINLDQIAANLSRVNMIEEAR